jgi:hypothetical protein
MHGRGQFSGDIIHNGDSVFDPVVNAQRMGRIQGVMLASAFTDVTRTRSLVGIAAWMLVGVMTMAIGLLATYDLVITGGHAPPLFFGVALVLSFGGFSVLAAQLENFASRHRRSRP